MATRECTCSTGSPRTCKWHRYLYEPGTRDPYDGTLGNWVPDYDPAADLADQARFERQDGQR